MLEETVMYNFRVVVLQSLKEEVLEGLHAAHQGIEGMKSRAMDKVFCPGITKDL